LCYFSAVGQSSSINLNGNNITQHHLYPNPMLQGNNCKLNVLLNEESAISVTIFDIIGNNVFETKAYYHKGTHNLLLETNTFLKGIYFINIVSNQEKYVKRLIVK